MPLVTEQQNPIPSPIVTRPTASKAIKAVRIFLLVIIVIGLGLIDTEKLWVPKLVNALVPSPIVNKIVQPVSTSPAPTSSLSQWVPLSGKQNSDYTENNGMVYCKNVPINGADISTFVVSAATSSINDGEYANNSVDAFAKDKNNVYECHDAGADPDPQYQVAGAAIVAGADPATFTLVFDSAGYFASFAKDKNNIYAVNWGNANILQGADPNSFVSLDSTVDPSDSFFKDKTHVYTWSGVIDGANPNTFKVIFESTSTRAVYGEDANHVYYANGRGAQLISGADPSTFTILYSNGYYAKDASHVYELGGVQTGVISILPGANPATFVIPVQQ